MKSPINWALLGLIIERESYAFELARRFQSIYRHVLTLSSTSHIYTALTVLQDRALIEQIQGTHAPRQPKPSYRATPLGIQGYGDWLEGHVAEDRRRQAQYVLALAALAANPAWVSETLDRHEHAWQAQLNSPEVLNLDGLPEGPGAELAQRILPAENKLTTSAKLTWIAEARQALASQDNED